MIGIGSLGRRPESAVEGGRKGYEDRKLLGYKHVVWQHRQASCGRIAH